MRWHALFVQTGKEDLVCNVIRKRFEEANCRAIVPMRRLLERKQGLLREVYKPILPGYVLVNIHMNAVQYNKLRNIPRVIKLLNKYTSHDKKKIEKQVEGNKSIVEKFESYILSQIENEEIEPILQLINSDNIIDFSSLYFENTKVVVHSGPLKGQEGIIRKIDKRKCRAKVCLNFLGNEKLIDLGIEMIKQD